MRKYLLLYVAHLFLLAWIAFSIEPWKETSVKFDCEYNGKPICCSLLRSRPTRTWHKFSNPSHRAHCKVNRVYRPSSYENRHRLFVERIHSMQNKEESERYEEIRKWIYYEYDASIRGLQLVKKHMSAPHNHGGNSTNSDDAEFLSRFIVTRTCGGGGNHTWVEYIEPLSFFARDIRGYIAAAELKRDVHISTNSNGKIPSYFDDVFTYLLSREYVLLQDSSSLSKLHSGTSGRHFFFDAGTSTFDTSLAWTLCAYQQRGISFDKAMAWEVKPINATDYWNDVPPNLVPLLHFYNTPISENYSQTHSVLRLIDEVAEEGDFVTFKLDVDTSSVEIPIALEILRNPKYHKKIDEFFFELHFHCEVVGPCCWDYDGVPQDINGFILDRLHAFNFFQELRSKGVRAHFWP